MEEGLSRIYLHFITNRIDSSNQPIHVYDSHTLHCIDIDGTSCNSWGRVVIKPSVVGEGYYFVITSDFIERRIFFFILIQLTVV